jgi:hypothetical protein
MVRHVPWDEMPSIITIFPLFLSLFYLIQSFLLLLEHYAINKKQLQQEEKKQIVNEIVVPEERNIKNDLNDIGKRMAFGAVV